MIGHFDARGTQIQALRLQIANGSKPSRTHTAPAGIAEIDICLSGGFARGGLHEVAAADHRSTSAALGFLLALSSLVCRGDGEPKTRRRRSILWPLTNNVTAFGHPYPPGLRFFGFDPARIVFVRCANARECLWAMEEGLQLGGAAAIIGARAKIMDLTASRRLQLAAEQATAPVFLLRGYNDHTPSAAVTRWRIAPASSTKDEFGFYKHARFRTVLEYARGGKPGEWVMEWDCGTLSLRLSSALGDRAAARAA